VREPFVDRVARATFYPSPQRDGRPDGPDPEQVLTGDPFESIADSVRDSLWRSRGSVMIMLTPSGDPDRPVTVWVRDESGTWYFAKPRGS